MEPTKPAPPSPLPPPRFQLQAIKRRINGVLSAEIYDRTTEKTVEVMLFEAVDNHILTAIDPVSNAVTLTARDMSATTLSTKTAIKDAAHAP